MEKNLISGEKGQTIVEAAVSVALLLTMLIGVIAGGLMLYTYHYLSYAARLGSRYAIVRGSACDNSNGMPDCPNVTSAKIQTYVKGAVHHTGIDPSQLTVTATWPNGTDNPGDPVSVRVQYPFPLWVPFAWSGTVTMHSTSQMVISQ
jgi:Flp pilus assembly protein TadG